MPSILRFATILSFAATLSFSHAIAQTRYDVASIRLSPPAANPKDALISFGPNTYKVGNIPSNHFDAQASTIGDILLMLNDWQPYRVVGGPQWINTDRYDIHARADAALPPEKQRDAVFALLAERFKLTVHRETRDTPTFVLLAPKKPSGLKPAPAGEEEDEHYTGGTITYTAVPMSDFTNRLTQMLGSPVIDKTELQGAFDITITLPPLVRHSPGPRRRSTGRVRT